jgi:hypothetical protein
MCPPPTLSIHGHDNDGTIAVDEVVTAVNRALDGCSTWTARKTAA